MSPVRLWFGLVFVAMGVLAVLDAAGAVTWSQGFEQWWPLAIVGWGLADLAAHRRVDLGATIVIALGLALLADEQEWAAEAVVWSALFLLIGGSILWAGFHRRRHAGEERPVGPMTAAGQG